MSFPEMPAVSGDVVTEAHATLCAVRGHATHLVDGKDTGICPRCGDVKECKGMADREIGKYTSTGSTEKNRDMYQVGDPNRVEVPHLVTQPFDAEKAYTLIDDVLNYWVGHIDEEQGMLLPNADFSTLRSQVRELAAQYPMSFTWCKTAKDWIRSMDVTDAMIRKSVDSVYPLPTYDDSPYTWHTAYARMFKDNVYRGCMSMSRAVRLMGE